jgi:hypothetical protein
VVSKGVSESVIVTDAKQCGVSWQMIDEVFWLISSEGPGDAQACIVHSDIRPEDLLRAGTPCIGHAARHCRFHTGP